MNWIFFVPPFVLIALTAFVLVRGDRIAELTRVKFFYFTFGVAASSLLSQAARALN